MVGPLLLTQEADAARRQLAEWALKPTTIPVEDYVVDDEGDRTYRVSKLKPLVDPLLKAMRLEVGLPGGTSELY